MRRSGMLDVAEQLAAAPAGNVAPRKGFARVDEGGDPRFRATPIKAWSRRAKSPSPRSVRAMRLQQRDTRTISLASNSDAKTWD